MNFKTYMQILQAEGLEESPLALGQLILATENKDDDEKRITYIWNAVDLARMYKDDPEMQQFIHEGFERINGRKYEGFLKEYQRMKKKE